jgi:hypothetical protein
MTRNDFLNRLGMLAKATEFHLTHDWVALYDRALSRFGYDRATGAVEAAILERRGNERMPSIGDLVHRCAPQVLDADTAVEVAGRIWTAISQFGQYRGADAANWIGEVGWYVVTTSGGWEKICQTAQAKDVGVWRAQLRDHAAAALRRHKAGVLGSAPSFGELANNKVAALVGDVLKKSETHSGSARISGNLSPQPGGRQLDAEDRTGIRETV